MDINFEIGMFPIWIGGIFFWEYGLMALGVIIAVIIVVIVVVVVIICVILYLTAFVVHEKQVVLLERLGKFKKYLYPGLHFLVPFIDRPRMFTWSKFQITPSGEVSNQVISSSVVDLRESIFNFVELEVFSKDNVKMSVNTLMFYKITNVKKAIYGVRDVQQAVKETSHAQVKEIFGQLTFTEALNCQEILNEHLSSEFQKHYEKFGISVERLELLNLVTLTRVVSDSMKTQMVAERIRRGKMIKAEGEKVAALLKATGVKTRRITMGIADEEATRKISEGEASARIAVARAESQSLEALNKAISTDGAKKAEYMIAQRYMEFVRSIGRTERMKLYLPYLIEGISGQIGNISKVFGRHGGGGYSRVEDGREETKGILNISSKSGEKQDVDEFDDLS